MKKTRTVFYLFIAAALFGVGWTTQGIVGKNTDRSPDSITFDAGTTVKSKLAALESLSPAEKWLRFAESLPGMKRRDFRRYLSDHDADPAALLLVGERWAQRDPEGFLAWLAEEEAEYPHGNLRKQLGKFVVMITREWAPRDPEGLFAAVDGQTSLLRELGMRAITEELLDTNTEIAIAAMQEEGYFLESEVVDRWIERDPESVAERINDIITGAWADRRFAEKLVDALSARDPEAAARWAMSVETGRTAKRHAIQRAFQHWAESDPGAAAEAALSIEFLNSRASALASVAKAWGESQPVEAIAWAAEYLESRNRDYYLTQIAVSGSKTEDGALAMEAAAMALPRKSMKLAALTGIAEARWGIDKNRTLEWITHLNDEDSREKAGWALRHKLDPNDANLVKELIEEHGTELMPSSITNGVAQRMVKRTSPQDALKWASALPASLAQSAQSAVYYRWAQTNGASAAAFVTELPAGESRNQALAKVARGWLFWQEEAALAWGEQLSPEDKATISSHLRDDRYTKPSRKEVWLKSFE